ncbi:MAG: Rrf2 family transcriptional regulator [Gammaproteobacteria bacterium]|jgi:Rrf2 family transcriptional regulator, nitric oxide-sensitive transcriptional repressor|nr:Rrf2 family transcriptional regulator [Gammaproteobacteria bacterium]MBU0772468.1 Rrf2 family transcriptional regulator [Gammaproteobacteria bacterium]MBU0855013.1 Rrf2 family transcriptional regulator [Gammaproteobacteria bacterium]MBU1847202.1 Rrf2 family transcriptional regulator [Gammaproteobacteria bacterium]
MRLTRMTDYAMRLLMHVGSHPGRLCTIAEIAGAHDISEAHLMKVTNHLARAGWLETVRGKGGGMRLAGAPQTIVLGEVVRSVEPDFRLVECFDPDSACRFDGRCGLNAILDAALHDFLARLDGHTLADILPAGASGAGVPMRRAS